MFDRFRKKPLEALLQEVSIGGGNLIIDLPAHYAVATDENNNTVAYDPNASDGILRFTVYYLSGEQERGAERLGVRSVSSFAKEKRKKLQRYESKVYFSEQMSGEEDGSEITMRFWQVGFEDCIVLISCRVSKTGEKSKAAQLAISSVDKAICALRNAPYHYYDAPENSRQEIFPLNSEHQELLRHWRSVAHELVTRVLGRPRLMGTERDFDVIQELLDNESVDTYSEEELRGLGVIFGDHLARKLDMQWMTIEDAWGQMPGLACNGLQLVLYPSDMILKRVERSESFAVIQLFNMTAELVRKEIGSGKVNSA